MAKIFITGSADGLGLMAAKLLINQDHEVVLHARNLERAKFAESNAPGAKTVLSGDLSDLQQTIDLAEAVNQLGSFDVIIHNAGVYQTSNELIFAVNTVAPYVLTSLIDKPKRLIYLSSGMHRQGRPKLDNLQSGVNYSDSKLHVLMVCKAIARLWPEVYANTIDPGWVPTKMGGKSAPDDLDKGVETQVWLATSEDNNARVTGKYFHHKKEDRYLPVSDDVAIQEQLLNKLAGITGIAFPAK
jgi:NAD(P)-dependent dehydrogenase (short-subunit alcohol dehydrogenase family)